MQPYQHGPAHMQLLLWAWVEIALPWSQVQLCIGACMPRQVKRAACACHARTGGCLFACLPGGMPQRARIRHMPWKNVCACIMCDIVHNCVRACCVHVRRRSVQAPVHPNPGNPILMGAVDAIFKFPPFFNAARDKVSWQL